MSTSLDVARMTRPERERRVGDLIIEANTILDTAIAAYPERAIVAVCVLYSGGNDSTTLAHLMRARATHAIHANTGIGIEATRQFVRDTCAAWQLPLIEKHAPVSYAELVLERGFPGAGQHWKMYHRLKERCLDAARHELGIANSRSKRAVFLAGRRRDESQRRMSVPASELDGSVIWVSPIVNWTKLDLNTYRLMHPDVPRNIVADTLHMSGECLCGSFAKRNELAEIESWYPGDVAQIRELERRLVGRNDIPAERRVWGWSAEDTHAKRKARIGALCTSCAGEVA